MDRPGAAVGHTRAVPGTSENNERAPRDPPGDSALIIDGIRALHHRLDEMEARLAPGRAVRPAGRRPGQPGLRPGVAAAHARRDPLQGITARRVLLPPGHDPNSFFVQGGDARQFQSLLEAAPL